eukprot:COSAG01_NODE_25622_length_739_cov_0.954688_1_plen_64_part_01
MISAGKTDPKAFAASMCRTALKYSRPVYRFAPAHIAQSCGASLQWLLKHTTVASLTYKLHYFKG